MNIELLFPPEAQMIQATGISIIDSPEPELLEEFTLLISAVSNASYSLGTTTAMISIVDNDCKYAVCRPGLCHPLSCNHALTSLLWFSYSCHNRI